MFFLWPLQTVLENPGSSERFEQPTTNRTTTYERGSGKCTKTLKHFFKKLHILHQLSLIFGAEEGIFCIPQLKAFLYEASRTLSDKEISQI
jgi:hypothetical protein